MEKQTFTNKQVVGISIVIGFFLSILVYFFWDRIPAHQVFIIPLVLLFSITGGFLGKKWRDSRQAIIIGATLGAVLAAPLGIVVAWNIIYYLMCC